MAGIACIEEILRLDPDRYDITVFGAEKYPNYNRILLSQVLQGETSLESLILNPVSWYEERGIRLYLNTSISRVLRAKKRIITSTGDEFPYDVLVLATGSIPVFLPLPGVDKEGVVSFRNIEDCRTIIATSKTSKRAAVIGGGLLGLEAARGLLNLGMETTVVHLMDRLMERQLDQTAAVLLKRALEGQGIRIMLGKETGRILGNGRVTGLQFKDGTEIPADLVVMAVGIRPNADLAREASIYCERGIVVSDTMQTYDPAVYAVGECVQHRGTCYGLLAPLLEQAKVMASHLAGDGRRVFRDSATATKLKVSGVDVFSAGEFIETEGDETVELRDSGSIYKKLILREGRLIGAVLFGDTGDGTYLFEIIRSAKEVSGRRVDLLFANPALGDTGHSGSGRTALLPDEAVICGCNGVTKKTILQAIREKGLFTREEVKKCTNASRSCGGCGPLVDELLMTVHGPDYQASPQTRPVCECTIYSREDVLRNIRDKHLTNTREVMAVLGWNTEGCTYCRPALNYYVSLIWPDEYEEDATCRLVNERNYANIQNDGTWSVVPRIYGGVTSPDQLRRIADVADKYKARMVKLTGGQRIDLLGIRKEDLPRVWADLDMPSGFAYAKAIRTVKSCVGTTFCRFGVQDSMQLAIGIEKKFERLNMPAKVKMAVSGCPRNCAESSIKDVGIVGIEGGWEIYVGGNGGIHVRAGNLLCSVPGEEEAVEVVSAYLQYYRETSQYAERTSVWLERIGLESVRKVIVEDLDQRKILVRRMEKALERLEDPWRKPVPIQFLPLGVQGLEGGET